MTPTSDDLQLFIDRVNRAYANLGTNRNDATGERVEELVTLAKDWLRLSPAVNETAQGFLSSLDGFDAAMAAVLKSAQKRTRTTAYRAHLTPFKDLFTDQVLIPFMKYEGSPTQASARLLQLIFDGIVSQDELAYINEAARCLAARCNRAAIVMLWAAAIARLHAAVGYAGFAAYNNAITASFAKKVHPFGRIQNAPVNGLVDLQLRSDFDLLVVGMEFWGYDSQAFSELNGCLNIRNNAAHPGSFEPITLDVRQFAEKLKRYVFAAVKVG